MLCRLLPARIFAAPTLSPSRSLSLSLSLSFSLFLFRSLSLVLVITCLRATASSSIRPTALCTAFSPDRVERHVYACARRLFVRPSRMAGVDSTALVFLYRD